MSTIQGISRPYVGQNARNIDDIKQVKDKPAGDVTSPAKPVVNRAWAFELAADGTSVVPPPPAGAPGRDPLVIELGDIEIGTRIELISLSDNPAAEFDKKCCNDIFELPLTGYDVGNRTATIALSEEQMKEKGIAAGERFLLRQVDKDGNASSAVHVFLDPNGWATQNLREPVQGGGVQNVRGAHIDIAVGIHNLPGNATPGTMERVLGKQTTDSTAPKLIENNVKVETTKVSAKDVETIKAAHAAFSTLFGNSNYDLATLETQLNRNQSSWANHGTYKAPYDTLMALVAKPAEFERLAALTGLADGVGDSKHFRASGAGRIAAKTGDSSFTTIKFDKALEPGVSANVQNSRTGETKSARVGDTSRDLTLILQDVKDGDPLIITYTDTAGNAGSPYGFNFDSKAKDGKARTNALDIRLGGFNLRPQPTVQN